MARWAKCVQGPAESRWTHVLGWLQYHRTFQGPMAWMYLFLNEMWLVWEWQHLPTSSWPLALAIFILKFNLMYHFGRLNGVHPSNRHGNIHKLESILVATRSNIYYGGLWGISEKNMRNILVCDGTNIHCPAYITFSLVHGALRWTRLQGKEGVLQVSLSRNMKVWVISLE